MEKETLTDNLEKLLMAIHRQVVSIRDAEQQVPKVDMDKALSNIRSLYEQFTVLNYLNTLPVENKVVHQSPSQVEEKKPVEIPTKKEQESLFVPIVEKQTEPKQPEIIQPEPKQQEITKPDVRAIEPEVHAKYQPVKPIVIEPEISTNISPQPLSQTHSVEPEISIPKHTSQPTNLSSEPQRLADKLRFQKLEDIHKAVTLSDKFLFMNELFEGENNSYKEAIDMLNRLSSASEANHYMDSLAARYRWADHAKVETKFRELVSRKFI